MTLKEIAQNILDNTLLQNGVLSHHIRRVKTDAINGLDVKINDNEYVVYRIVSSNDGAYGDGKAHCNRSYIDINYYYNYDKDDTRYVDVVARVESIINAFISDKHFRLKNAASDITDIDNPYRGINVEFMYVEAIKRGRY